MGQRRVICPTHRERSRRLLGLPTLLDDRGALTSSGIRETLSTTTFSKLTIMQKFNIPRQSNVRQRKERSVQPALPTNKRSVGANKPWLESSSRLTAFLTACVVAGLAACTKPTIDQGLDYPDTRVSEHTDLYHSEAVSDPYRWLEDDLSTETKDWIERQNDTPFGYLANSPYRDEFKDRYAALIDYPTNSAPFTEGDWQYFYQNSGTQNHSVLMRRRATMNRPSSWIPIPLVTTRLYRWLESPSPKRPIRRIRHL